jgi:hypothetical protein
VPVAEDGSWQAPVEGPWGLGLTPNLAERKGRGREDKGIKGAEKGFRPFTSSH